jgi:tRNA (mo5U34)-methyltransferase
MTNYTKKEIELKIKELGPWQYNIDINGIQTTPTQSNYLKKRWESIEPYIPDSLNGKTVLDLGCGAGHFSIKMKQRGADVLGVDWYKKTHDQAKFAAEVLDLNIQYKLENIYEFLIRNKKVFDYVLFLGVFYHLRYPLLALDKIGEIAKEKLYFQTIVTDSDSSDVELEIPNNITNGNSKIFKNSTFPKMYFIEKKMTNAYNNWFVCNSNAVRAILRSSGFTNIISSDMGFFICEPIKNKPEWRASHSISDIKLKEPPQNSQI